MGRQKIGLAALEEMIVGIARSQPTTADVCAVSVRVDPPPRTAGDEAAAPTEWFVESFRRDEEHRAMTDDDAVRRELRDIADSLRQTYRVEGD